MAGYSHRALEEIVLIPEKILWHGVKPKKKLIMLRAMATNSQLKLRASDIIEKAKADYETRLEPATKLIETLFSPDEQLEEVGQLVPESTWYRSLCYKTQKSWSRSRRVVTKGALWQ